MNIRIKMIHKTTKLVFIVSALAVGLSLGVRANSDPMTLLIEQDPVGFIKQQLVDVPEGLSKEDSKVLKYAIVGTAAALLVGSVAWSFVEVAEFVEGRRVPVNPFYKLLTIPSMAAVCSAPFVCVGGILMTIEKLNTNRYADALSQFLNYYFPSDTDVLVDGEQYCNNRRLVPQELVPFFDALCEQYQKTGRDYLQNHAEEISKILAHWCSTHADGVSTEAALSVE
jgi:hypothetical protein